MTKKYFAMMLIYVSLVFTFVSSAHAVEDPNLLTREIPATAIKGETIAEVLDLIANEYGIPIGLELGDPQLASSRKMDLNLPKTNLKDFLDSLVAKDSRYTWKLDGGIIHVWPVAGRDTLVASLLDTKISHFAFTGGPSRYTIYNDIFKIPEIRTQLIVEDVAPMIFLSSGTMRKVGKEILFVETNLTLRELLDRLLMKTDIKRWALFRWGDRNEFITLRS